MMAAACVPLNTGGVHVTRCVLDGVKQVCVTKTTAAVICVSLDTGGVTVRLHVVPGVQGFCVPRMTAAVCANQATLEDNAIKSVPQESVRRAITTRANAPYARIPANMEIIANIDVVVAVLIRHVTLHQESVIRVMMVTLGHIVTLRVKVHALKVGVMGSLENVMKVSV